MSFNKISIYGYLGRDPELKYTLSGTAVCDVSVATTEKRKNRDGYQEDVTTWFKCTCWGKTAELVSEHFQKGSAIYLEGKMRLEEWTDREGRARTTACVNVSGFEFVGGGKSPGEAAAPAKAEAAPQGRPQQQSSGRQQPRGRQVNEDDSDIPF